MKTLAIKEAQIESQWVVIDAAGQTLGRLATQAATLLMGKHKAIFSPHLDTGDHVIVVNAAKVRVTGKKLEQKVYVRHSGYPGGLRSETLSSLLERKPVFVIEHAVRGMLPKTRLGDAMVGKLRVYAGPEHPHQGQISPGSGAAKRPRISKEAPPPTTIEEEAPSSTTIEAETEHRTT